GSTTLSASGRDLSTSRDASPRWSPSAWNGSGCGPVAVTVSSSTSAWTATAGPGLSPRRPRNARATTAPNDPTDMSVTATAVNGWWRSAVGATRSGHGPTNVYGSLFITRVK